MAKKVSNHYKHSDSILIDKKRMIKIVNENNDNQRFYLKEVSLLNEKIEI